MNILKRIINRLIDFSPRSGVIDAVVKELVNRAEEPLKQIEYKGYLTHDDFRFLVYHVPEAYMVAQDILHIKGIAVYEHIKNNRILSEDFVPSMRKGISEFYYQKPQ